MGSERVFGGQVASSQLARKWVSGLLEELGAGEEARFRTELVLAELVSNGIRHTRSGGPEGSITVRVRVGSSLLRLEVTDQGSETCEPRAKRAGHGGESGHGLFLVESLSWRWWTKGNGEGRTMFAEIPHGLSESELPEGQAA